MCVQKMTYDNAAVPCAVDQSEHLWSGVQQVQMQRGCSQTCPFIGIFAAITATSSTIEDLRAKN